MRSKINLKNTFLPPLPPSWLLSPPCCSTGRWGVRWSVHLMLFLLLLREKSPSPAAMWSPSCWRQSSMDFCNVSPSCRLWFFTNHSSVGPFPTGCSPSGTDCPSVGPASKPAPLWAPLSMDPQVLPGACSRVSFPWGRSLLQASTCCDVGSSRGCRWISVPLWSPCATGAQLPHQSLQHRLQGHLSSWSTFSPSFFTALGVCRAVSLTPLFSGHNCFYTITSSFLL